MVLKQRIVVGATALVGMGIGSIGLGVAHAETNPAPNVGVHTTLDTSSPEPAETVTSAESDGPGGHQDPNGIDVQYGSQSGPDTGGSDTSGS